MAADTGVFAFFAPVSFHYFHLNDYRIPFAIASALLAVLAGYLARKRDQAETKKMMVKGVMNKI